MNQEKIKEVFKVLQAPFHPDDIEWRPQRFVKNGKTQALAYVTARAVMERLDKAVGPANWDIGLEPIDMGVTSKLDKQGNTTDLKGFKCALILRIEDEEGNVQYVQRSDVANLTDFEAIKGGASGAMKRAAVQFGIGRYLYGIGDTWAETDDYGRIKTIPRLPDWALPEGFTYPEGSANVKYPSQPAHDSGDIPVTGFDNGSDEYDTTSDDNLLITFGKHNGKRFSDIPLDYIQWLSNNAQKADIKEAAKKWVETHGNAGSEDAPW